MSTTGDCIHRGCATYNHCRSQYQAAYKKANHERMTAYYRAYNAGRRLARRQAREMVDQQEQA